MTASKPACSTTFAISRASVATTRRSQMPSSAMRRVTTTMRGSPPSGRSGLRGSRLEPSRAGITPRTGTGEDTKSVPLSLPLGYTVVVSWPITRLYERPCGSYDAQEILEHAFPVFRPDGLGMKLHAVRRVIPMLHGHDLGCIARTLAIGAHRRHHQS